MAEMTDWEELLLKGGFEEKAPSTVLLDTAIHAFLHMHQQQFTQIQSQAIQPIYAGENALLISSTASGKTEAAVIPIAARISQNRKSSLCIYIAPTKALLNDLYNRLSPPLHRLEIKLGIRHGDKQLSSMDRELSFLLTTPESLDILICNNYPFLSKIKFVICDEIHQIYGSPRGMQLLFLLERLKKKAGDFQRVALSATVGDQEAVGKWFLGGSGFIKIFSSSYHRPIYPDIIWLGSENSLEKILQRVKAKKILIFVNSRRKCDELFLEISHCQPYKVLIHYSNLERSQREYIESQFRKAEFAICIATTTLELGIDIGSIESVILYEPPKSVTSFLQRIGRGGRREGKTWVIMTPKNYLELLHYCALTLCGCEGILESIFPGHFYSVLIQQIFSLVAAKHHHRVHRKELIELCESFPWIDSEDLNLILNKLSSRRYLRHEIKWESYQVGPQLESLFNERAIFSNISNGGSGTKVFHGGRPLASLPLPSDRIRLGEVILFAGRYWKITSIGVGQISVHLTNSISSAIRPSYGGGGGNHISSIVTEKIKMILTGKSDLIDINFDKISKNHIQNFQAKIPSEFYEDHIFYSKYRSKNYYLTFAGSTTNKIIQIIFSKIGFPVQLINKGEGIGFHCESLLDLKLIPDKRDIIYELISNEWHKFVPFVNVGPFFDLLPISLKRKEIISQINLEKRITHILKLRNFKLYYLSDFIK